MRGYIIELLNDGVLKGAKSPAAVAKKVAATVARDVPLILGDMAEQALSSGVANLLGNIANEISLKGLGATWESLQQKYTQGARNLRRGPRAHR